MQRTESSQHSEKVVQNKSKPSTHWVTLLSAHSVPSPRPGVQHTSFHLWVRTQWGGRGPQYRWALMKLRSCDSWGSLRWEHFRSYSKTCIWLREHSAPSLPMVPTWCTLHPRSQPLWMLGFWLVVPKSQSSDRETLIAVVHGAAKQTRSNAKSCAKS